MRELGDGHGEVPAEPVGGRRQTPAGKLRRELGSPAPAWPPPPARPREGRVCSALGDSEEEGGSDICPESRAAAGRGGEVGLV